MNYFRKLRRPFALTVLCSLLVQLGLPTTAFAITGHNSMPEYRSFEPVATTNMVNVFDGSFTYNIPLLDIPNGYPVNLSYHSSDVNNEAQASWVGLGWTLNPGAINRVKRGFPDEFDGDAVKYHGRMPKNWTISASIGGGMELFGGEQGDLSVASLNLEATIRYNNYQGIGTAVSGGISGPIGIASLGFNYSQGRLGFQPEINPGAIFSAALASATGDKKAKSEKDQKIEKAVAEAIEKLDPKTSDKMKKYAASRAERLLKNMGTGQPQIGMSIGGIGAGYGAGGNVNFSMAPVQPSSMPTAVSPYTGAALRLKVELGTNPLPVPIDVEGTLSGSYAQQTNEPVQDLKAYGYMNLEKSNDDDAIMDYATENDKLYEKRDNILAVPMPNNDMYSLTGEAIGGSFRPYRAEFGHYRKNKVKSETYSANAGADINIASIATVPPLVANLVYTVGGNLGGDYHTLSVGNWDDNLLGDSDEYIFRDKTAFPNTNENFFFRFSGDKAGSFDLSGNDAPYRAGLNKSGLTASPSISGWNTGGGHDKVESRSQTGRSTYIGHSTHEDHLIANSTTISSGGTNRTIPYKTYEKNLQIVVPTSATTTNVLSYDHTAYPQKAISEFVTNNTEGIRYVYGLPIHSRNEKELQYSLNNGEYSINADGLTATISNAGSIDANAKRKLGYEANSAYATTHLLTQICSPDYVDRTMDGLTSDDFGSYTRFNYIRETGAGNGTAWYPYRTPYKGVSFSHGSLSEDNDDMGSFSYGEKEIYYPHSISSKTHVAFFILEERPDGFSAELSNSPTATDLIKGGKAGDGKKKLKMLRRIELYSIDDCAQRGTSGIYQPVSTAIPIKTVRFAYDYSLCPGIDNNTKAVITQNGVNINAGQGKLTLKKVWFEYEGKLTSKISPYRFEYAYPTSAQAPYPSVYTALQTYTQNYTANAQNPSYDPSNTDRWGNYRNFVGLRTTLNPLTTATGDLARFWPYVNQAEDTGYDPAAYCLKRITLPSGGEIHVQYEQNDYQYVQNERATIMVPLLNLPQDENSNGITDSEEEGNADLKGKKYYLDLNKIGTAMPASATDKDILLHDLFEPVKSARMYFSFLYGLIGAPDYTKNNSEYIEGYARIAGYGRDDNGFFFVFKGSPDTGDNTVFYPINYGAQNNKREIPQKVCKDFYNSSRRGKIDGTSNALGDENADDESRIRAMLTVAASAGAPNPALCRQMDPSMSYVRLQSHKAKKGGGVRVKRLLMYDAGMTAGDPASLYGQEYSYGTMVDGVMRSSGVATNEPSSGRRENALVNPMDKDEQTKIEAILYGRDMYGQEGPVGESLLPSPSVGYSFVTIKSIHTGATNTGYEVHEFYTCKDYPFIADKTEINQVFEHKLGASAQADGIGVGYSRNTPYMSQGYSFIMNEMHGQPKRIAKYGADVATIVGRKKPAVAEQVYEYYEPGAQVQVMDENFQTAFATLGKESEILSEMRQVEDITTGGNIEADLSAGGVVLGFPPFALPVVIPTFKEFGFYTNENILRTHVTSKIIQYPAILKKVTNIADGVRHITENQVFDKFTGNPVVIKSYDDFEGTYLSQDFMASWNYENMRSKALNERVTSSGTAIYHISGAEEYIEFSAGDKCGEAAKFTRGDLVQLSGTCSNGALLYHIDRVDMSKDRLYIIASGLKPTGCTPANNANVGPLTVINSGYTNQLSAKMGNIMTHDKNGGGSAYTSGATLNATSNQLVVDLNNKLNTLTPSSTSGDLVLDATHTYSNLSVFLDKCYLDAGCNGSGAGVTLSNIVFGYQMDSTAKDMKLWVKSFVATDTRTGVAVVRTVNCSSSQGSNGPTPVSYPGFVSSPVNNSANASLTTGCTTCRHYNHSVKNVPLHGYSYSWASSDTSIALERCRYYRDQELVFNPDPFIPTHNPLRVYKWKALKKNGSGVLKDSGKSLFFYNYRLSDILETPHDGAEYALTCKSYKLLNQDKVMEEVNMTLIIRDSEPVNCTLTPSATEAYKSTTNPTFIAAYTTNYLHKAYEAATYQWVIENNSVFSTPAQFVGSSTSANASINFFDTGVYLIKVTITNSLGKCKELYTTFNFKASQSCNASIAGQSQVCLIPSSDGLNNSPASVTFTRQVAAGESCAGAWCEWTMRYPDGSESNLSPNSCSTKTVSFSSPGRYIIALRASVNGNITTGQHVIEVKDCRPPRATFTLTNPTCPGQVVYTNVTSSSQVDKYEWDFGDGFTEGGIYASHKYDDCGSHVVTLKVTNAYGTYTTTQTYSGNSNFMCHPVCACYSSFPLGNFFDTNNDFRKGTATFTAAVGKFYLDEQTGQFVFSQAGCPRTYPFDCITLCGSNSSLPPASTFLNVVTASATTFADDWYYDESIYNLSAAFNGNSYEKGMQGKWRPKSQYTFRAPLTGNKNFEAGLFTLDVFDWKEGNNDPDKWLRVSNITQYSPNGEPLEEHNILNIYSTAKYGYNHTLPVLVAQNAQDHTVAYESFENLYSKTGTTQTYFEDGVAYDATKGLHTSSASVAVKKAHTGKHSVRLVMNQQFSVGTITKASQVIAEGILVRGWFHASNNKLPLNGKLKVHYGASAVNMHRVSSAGEWVLYEAYINNITGTGNLAIKISSTETDIYMDDVRIQPVQSEMVAYVYDKAQRLIAVLDDQHYAMIYEYNAEGMLIRKLKETIEGIKTISETQYNSKGEVR